ncbi:hypothetical protein ARMGADRAFT_1035955 [Armillaria gallica]|uniref:Uncharacterized protein n=1 Tax=Armillaria gallica TaxID=47427 RepID=A0A2H3CSF7_ARMGA|nr:hypothetical protein ARMGADRAFT_1035955 [Armillaria gallica]
MPGRLYVRDGTILRASSLFSAGVVPPVVSFLMGSLGFLLPFPVAVLTGLLLDDARITLAFRVLEYLAHDVWMSNPDGRVAELLAEIKHVFLYCDVLLEATISSNMSLFDSLQSTRVISPA